MFKSRADLLYEFDDLQRCQNTLINNNYIDEFLKYVKKTEEARLQDKATINESQDEINRLKTQLDRANKDITVLNSKLTAARKWVDTERAQRQWLEKESAAREKFLEEIRRFIMNDPRYLQLPDDTRERLTSFSKSVQSSGNGYRTAYDRLNTITELDSSSVSEISISRSEDDLDDTNPCMKGTRKHRPSYLDEEPITIRKKRSAIYIPHTPTAPRAESLESLESDKKEEIVENVRTPAFSRINNRLHDFVSIRKFSNESCLACEKSTLFRASLKCNACSVVAHFECQEKIPLPCVPTGTPTRAGVAGTVSDYAPLVPPMIPAIVIHCINEVEQRGLEQIGIYRIPGTQEDVRALKNKLLKCKAAPNLSEYDIYVVCCCLKNFLRELRDALIPQSKWEIFAKAVSDKDKANKLYQAISTLPQPNRDTLAFLILHLQRVANSVECKMPVENLATVFGPSVVGHINVENIEPFTQAQISNKIMEELLSLSAEYWSSFIVEPSSVLKTPGTLRNTPSTESLMRKTSRKFLTTPGSRKKYFNTPPQYKH